ncbi:hypothetical protein Bca4012_070956 [Brassica carinata]
MHVVSGSDRDRDSSWLIRLSIHQTPSSIRFRRMRFSGTRQRERERERDSLFEEAFDLPNPLFDSPFASTNTLFDSSPTQANFGNQRERERESTEREWTGFFPF